MTGVDRHDRLFYCQIQVGRAERMVEFFPTAEREILRRRTVMSKSFFAVLVFAIALFASGPIARIVAHGQSDAGVAWAQDATDTDDSADVSTEPAVKPPDIAGDWAGDIDDNNPAIGEASFSIDIFQKKSKLKGDWTTGLGGSGTFTGKIKADGETLSFKLKQKHSKCKTKSEGTLEVPADVSPDVVAQPEIVGTYTTNGKCDGAEGGTFTLTFVPND